MANEINGSLKETIKANIQNDLATTPAWKGFHHWKWCFPRQFGVTETLKELATDLQKEGKKVLYVSTDFEYSKHVGATLYERANESALHLFMRGKTFDFIIFDNVEFQSKNLPKNYKAAIEVRTMGATM